MSNDSEVSHFPDCKVCYVPHDPEIHEATLRVRGWLNGELKRRLSTGSEPEFQAVEEFEHADLESQVA